MIKKEIAMLWRKIFLGSLLVIALAAVWSCDKTDDNPFVDPESGLSDDKKYFLEIAMGPQFAQGNNFLTRWTDTIFLFNINKQYTHLNSELARIAGQINDLKANVHVSIVENESEATLKAYFGDANTYALLEPDAAGLIGENSGFSWITWNNKNEILGGTFFVDVNRTTLEDCQKHVLREKLTQSLGLLFDSQQYPNSIFYKDWTCTTEYDPLDISVIRYHYNVAFSPGMARADVVNVLKRL